jgi:SM-20-related protein
MERAAQSIEQEFSGHVLTMNFSLAPRPDLEALRLRYQRCGRVHVRDVLEPTGAQNLLGCLLASDAWALVFNRDEQLYELDAAMRRTVGEVKLQQIAQAAHVEARYTFRYLYETIRVVEHQPEPDHPVPELKALAQFFNTEPFLQLARQMTGCVDIAFADCQATRYRAGHFLNPHDDNVAGKERVAAYVLNLTPTWAPAWGGQLQFLSEDGHVSEAFVPTFNALNLLRVPQRHLVSMVNPLADPACPRISVTGWLRRS